MTDDRRSEEFPIDVQGVEKSFGKKHVLSGLDLRVKRGETLVVMGMSGTGKSVTLKILAGLVRPDAGTVRVAGVDVTSADRREMSQVRSRLGFLFQGAALIRWMTAAQNVALPMIESGGVPEAEARDRAQKKLEEVGLGEAASQYPDELSGGQKKRVGFVRATALDPEILLYDEPTTGLDPITKRTVDELIVRGRDKHGATGVVVSHDLRSAMRVADQIALLYEGRLAVVAPPKEFLKSDHEIVRQFVADDGESGKGSKEKTP